MAALAEQAVRNASGTRSLIKNHSGRSEKHKGNGGLVKQGPRLWRSLIRVFRTPPRRHDQNCINSPPPVLFALLTACRQSFKGIEGEGCTCPVPRSSSDPACSGTGPPDMNSSSGKDGFLCFPAYAPVSLCLKGFRRNLHHFDLRSVRIMRPEHQALGLPRFDP